MDDHLARREDTIAAAGRVDVERIVSLGEFEAFARGWVDGGVRRGLDVAIALALGARGVLIGRPILWALATDGERGVTRALAILREELEIAMALLGAPTPGDITRHHVERAGSVPSGA